jgi:hypothetical protein
MPDCGGSFASATRVSSHELNEAMTDAIPTPGSSPEFPQAWNNASGSEVGDLGERTLGTVATPLGAFSVQGFWDEITKACVITRTYASDYTVSFATNSASLATGTSAVFNIQTATASGPAQSLALSVVTPPGVSASLSQSRVNSGQTVALTVSATAPIDAAQIVVRAEGTTGKAAQSHTAALLIKVK